ncbi:PAS/PAC sensor signal transduction histidine kinase [Solidesulfovibrio carbinoliphilus subsp. oakridgensis]|uniref:histidine kinase n=1 Tax=Solidesulfovibrio carbinoliphilus subsp. oakridgensis TaxID=694327 RepID=G7Q783_9BACT|nr:PAS domain-containing protein [Solidesulfovibrio carbinoliphilus]EHJ49040.1 PAS/PAC sensor signal transduction histidine kinase [Solidesulfovibrio carbinoliphilus subsp. oakridgensis]
MSRSRSRSRDRAAPVPGGPDARLPFFQALFESTDEGLCFLGADRRVVAANGAMRRLYAGKDFDAAGPCPETGSAGEEICGNCPAEAALASGRTVSLVAETVGPKGEPRQVETVCHPLRGPDGRVFGVAEIARDVTRRFEAERDMAVATRDIEMLLGSIRSILVTLDDKDRIRRFNARAEAILGLTAGAVIGRDFFDVGLAFDGEAVREAVAESRRTLLPVRVDEVRCQVPGHGERLLGLTANPVPGPTGTVPGVLLLGQDLSEIKARELKAVHARRMQAIGGLAAGIAHEINTPIQYVGYNAGFLDEAFTDILDLLAAYGRLAEAAEAAGGADGTLAEAVRAVRRVEAQVEVAYLRDEIPAAIANSRKGIGQVTEIVSAMRQMSHPGTGDSIFFDCNAAMRDIVTITRNTWKHVADVQFDLAPELPLVYGLPHEVSQVFLNVVLNAAQAVEERVSREPWTRGRIVVTTSRTGQGVVAAVADNGPGIDPAVQGRVFDPFFTTKAVGKGTGQGLAICQAIMVRHGGSIDFATRPGEGTTFFIRFPLERAADGSP